MLSSARFAFASFARVVVVKFVASMSASADVLALASAEFELAEVPLGTTITVKWLGKPVVIINQTPKEIDNQAAVVL